MDEPLKRRLVGAAVIVSLGIIFLPMILDGGRHTDFEKIRIEIPSPPERGFSSRIEPLTPVSISSGQASSEPTRPDLPADAIDEAGKAPTVDEEISEIIKPIEPATKVVNKPVSVSQPKVEDTKKPGKAAPAPQKPPVVAKKYVPKAAASPVSAWVVQVGSFDSRENAVILRDKLRNKGFVAFVESFENAGTSSHRVRIGPEVERSKAELALADLQKKMSLKGIIVSYP